MATRDRKYNNLLLELKYLYARAEYSDEIYDQAKREFEEYAKTFCEENGIEIEGTLVPNNDVTELDFCREQLYDDIELGEDTTNIFCKSLFKKIATKTHPDKLASLSKEEKERKSELFKKARKAVNANQWFILVQIAQELKIQLPEIQEEHVELLEKELKNIKQTIHNMEGTYAWNFFNQEDDMKKRVLMIIYLKNFGIDLTKVNN